MRPVRIAIALTFSAAAGIASLEAEMVQLHVLNRCTTQLPFGTDRYTSASNLECTAASEGQIFYILGQSVPNSVPLYRLRSLTTGNHMDYLVDNFPGYVLEGTLGWVNGAQDLGTAEIKHYVLGSDNATGQTNDPVLGPLGYQSIGGMGFGYPRHYLKKVDFVEVTGGENIKLKANRVAGGAVWELSWNGKQFINHIDYGRQIQTAVFWTDSPGSTLHNPTQAGDAFARPNWDPWPWYRGSPVATLSASGNVLTTRSIPLEWDPRLWDGDPSNNPTPQNPDPYGQIPILYRGWQLGQTFTVGLPGFPRVVKTVTQVTSDTAVGPYNLCCGPGVQTIAWVLGHAPHGEPPAQQGFTRYYTWRAQAPPGKPCCLAEVTPLVPICDLNGLNHPDWIGAGGVITTTANGDYALGIYGRKPADGGGVDFFQIVRGWNDPPCWGAPPNLPPDPADHVEFSAIAALRQTAIAVGTASYTEYFIVGTLQSVQNDMRALYDAGY